jgi:hypothetical protein
MESKLEVFKDYPVSLVFRPLKNIQKDAIERWKEEGSCGPSFFPNKNDTIKIFKLVDGKVLHSKECVNWAKQGSLFLPNATGLVILEKLDCIYDFMPNGAFALGIDYFSCLYHSKSLGHHMIPALRKDGRGQYSYLTFSWNLSFDPEDYPVFFKRG